MRKERLTKEVRGRTGVAGVFPAATPSSAWSARCWSAERRIGRVLSLWALEILSPAEVSSGLLWGKITLVSLD